METQEKTASCFRDEPEPIRCLLRLSRKEELGLVRPGQTAMDYYKVKAGALVAKHPSVPPEMRPKVVALLMTGEYLAKYAGDLPGVVIAAAQRMALEAAQGRTEYLSSCGSGDSGAFLGW